ncbi:MAG: fabG [Gammaproteobacteria bacterium]|jgi:3-oxoacyl-[acyl-carrier protein] reductase|nr:fabG [Gammaproteobacteria bacterium]
MTLTESKQHIALVTGASRGIGRAIALALGKAGHTVVGTATTEKGAENITQMLQEAGIQGEGRMMNVTSQAEIDTVFDAVQTQFGAPDILINNAGVTRDNIMLRMKDEEWDTVIDTNLNGVYRVTRACIKSMVKNRWGRIITISSVGGLIGNPGQANYTATKAAVIAFSKSLAREIGIRGVTVNIVAPGFIETDMTAAVSGDHRDYFSKQIALGRFGKPEEIAAAVLFLTSDHAAYITGETLHVNGGLYMA